MNAFFAFNRIQKEGGHTLPPKVTYQRIDLLIKFYHFNFKQYLHFNLLQFLFTSKGPKPKTIADFWTMIWQEDVCNIVCLTNLTEGTKVNTL